MSRAAAIARAEADFDSGRFRTELAALIAMPTESQDPQSRSILAAYLDHLTPRFTALGYTCRVLTHAKAGAPFLYAERIEDAGLPTIFGYGHGDVVRGQAQDWGKDLSPWQLTVQGDNWYGRGTADNKGQHSIHLAAIEAVLQTRGKLGFNSKFLIQMGEEIGSPGMRELCQENKAAFSADALIASDGPRLGADRPTIFLGSRGIVVFDLTIEARERAQHSGNWGGLLSDPAIQLAHAIASITSHTGQIRIAEWVPRDIPASVRRALVDCEPGGGPLGPKIDKDWGEPGLSSAEKVFGWSSFDVLAMLAGNPRSPVNAVPPRAWARCQLRFVAGVEPGEVLPALRRHLDARGFAMVQIAQSDEMIRATRLDPDDAWVQWTVASLARTIGKKPSVLPNLGGSMPNDIFADTLGLRTIWVPHSYPGCAQHAPNEHLPAAVIREGLAITAGLYWDLGEPGTPKRN